MTAKARATAAEPSNFVAQDLVSGLVVFLVALPLCLGVALASDAPLFSGIVSGIIGGIVVGVLSGSHTSVSGPAAGLTAIVATQIGTLGSFPAFLTAVVLAGVLQLGLGALRAGFLAAFFPSSVIKGLLAAIGIILILKQIPHVLGHDPDPVGEMTFQQPDGENTFTELLATALDIQPGAALLGLLSLALMLTWSRIPVLGKSKLPPALVVVLLGGLVNWLWTLGGNALAIVGEHLVQVPVADGLSGAADLLVFPDFAQLANPAILTAAFTVAVVASLETLLNLEAVDRIDPRNRHSPPNRELLAQGVGNIMAGMLGGLPMTSVIVRSSVNISTGNRTRLSAVFHGVLLLGSVLLVPQLLNRIPLSSLAAILLATGLKLASPKLMREMWREGKQQFLPFAVTVLAIVLIDLLVGILIGLGVSLAFILYSNYKRPLNRVIETHPFGEVVRVELANQVSFFSRAALQRTLDGIPDGGHILLDARNTDYVDPDILDLIQDFTRDEAKARGIEVSLLGFRDHYPDLPDKIRYVEHSSQRLQQAVTGADVLALLQEGNQRFRNGEQVTRDLRRQVAATAPGQAPLAVALSCMDSRAPVELIFDMGIGDLFSVRVAGNVAARKVLGSLEYGCVVAGAKLLLVLGHTACGAVTSAVKFRQEGVTARQATGCEHIDVLIRELRESITQHGGSAPPLADTLAHERYVDGVSRTNVLRTMAVIREKSSALDQAITAGQVMLVGGLYDVRSGEVMFFDEMGRSLARMPLSQFPQAAMAETG